jgi:hypothetical protein
MQKKSVAYEMPMKAKINKQTKKIKKLLIKKSSIENTEVHAPVAAGGTLLQSPSRFISQVIR